MPKVELTKIRLAVTAISKTIVATIPNKAGTIMLQKHDVSSDFQRCIIDYGAGSVWNIAAEGKEGSDEEYQVACVKKNGFKNALYTRKQVAKLIADAVKDGADEKSVEEWVKKKLI